MLKTKTGIVMAAVSISTGKHISVWKPENYLLKGKGLSYLRALQRFTLVKHNLPDSLQCASIKIPKLYDIFQLK